MIAVAGSTLGNLLVVITLVVVLYAEGVPWWIPGWVGACGAGLLVSGVLAWQRPRALVRARPFLLLDEAFATTTAVVGVGSSAPAFRMWIQLGLGDPIPHRLDVAAVGVALGLLCACYLAFVAAELERGTRLEALAPARR